MLSIQSRSYVAWIFLLLILIVFAGLRPVGFDSDSPGYESWILYDIYQDRAEISFILIVDFWRFFIELESVPRMVFLTYATINILILKFAIENYTVHKVKALLLYFLLLYSIMTLTQIRVGVASTIFFWAIIDIINRNKVSYFSKIALAISFHSMAIIFILFYFINTKSINKVFYLLVFPIGMVVVQFTDVFKSIVEKNIGEYLPALIYNKVSSYLAVSEQSVSTYNFWFMFTVVIYYVLLINVEKFDRKYIVYVKVMGVGILMSFFTVFLSDMSLRLTNSVGLLLLFLIPDISRIFKQYEYVLYVLFFISYLIFVNTHFRNYLLHLEVLFGGFVSVKG